MNKHLLTLLAFIISFSTLIAQVPPPPDYHENTAGGPGAPSATPVDQYLFVLMAFAIAGGVYLLYKRKQVFN